MSGIGISYVARRRIFAATRFEAMYKTPQLLARYSYVRQVLLVVDILF
jgi:hypothetical protein